jgi:hypothetical protein
LTSLKSGLNVYPNPATNQLQIELKKEVQGERAKVQLFNQIGQIVKKRSIGQQQTQFNTTYLEGGIYFLRVYTKNKVWRTKIVVK